MSTTTSDARAVVAAVDRLTTQVQRIADALSTPVADGPTTPATTCSAQYRRPDGLIIECIRAAQHEFPRHTDSDGCNWSDAVAIYPTNAKVKTLPPVPYSREVAEDERPLRKQLATADEDQERTARRYSISVLLSRTKLTDDEDALLRRHVETEMREADTARAITADYRTTNRTLLEQLAAARKTWKAKVAEAGHERDVAVEDLAIAYRLRDEAEATAERVRSTLQTVLATFAAGAAAGEPVTYQPPNAVSRETFERWGAALDGTDQPTTKE